MTTLIIGDINEGAKYWSVVNNMKIQCGRIYKGLTMNIWQQLSSNVRVHILVDKGFVKAIIYALAGMFICWNASAASPILLTNQDWVRFDLDKYQEPTPTPQSYLPKLGELEPFGPVDQRALYWVGTDKACCYMSGHIYHGGYDYYSASMPILTAALIDGGSAYVLNEYNGSFIIEMVLLNKPAYDPELTTYTNHRGSIAGNGYIISGDNGITGDLLFASFAKDLTYCIVVTRTITSFSPLTKVVDVWRIDFSLKNTIDDFITPVVLYSFTLPYYATITDVWSILGHYELTDTELCFLSDSVTKTTTTTHNVASNVTTDTATITFSRTVNVCRINLNTGDFTETSVYTESQANTAKKVETEIHPIGDPSFPYGLYSQVQTGTRYIAPRKALVLMVDYLSNALLVESYPSDRTYSVITDNYTKGGVGFEEGPGYSRTPSGSGSIGADISLNGVSLWSDSISYSGSTVGNAFGMIPTATATDMCAAYLDIWLEPALDVDYTEFSVIINYTVNGDDNTGHFRDRYTALPQYGQAHDGHLWGQGNNYARVNNVTLVRVSDVSPLGTLWSKVQGYGDVFYPPSGSIAYPNKTLAFKTTFDDLTNSYVTNYLGEIDAANFYPPPTVCLTVNSL